MQLRIQGQVLPRQARLFPVGLSQGDTTRSCACVNKLSYQVDVGDSTTSTSIPRFQVGATGSYDSYCQNIEGKESVLRKGRDSQNAKCRDVGIAWRFTGKAGRVLSPQHHLQCLRYHRQSALTQLSQPLRAI